MRRSLFTLMSLGSLSLGVSAMTAHAQGETHPRLAPTRDVTVVYAVQPGNETTSKDVKVAFAKNGDKLRIAPMDDVAATILDKPAQTVTLVMMKPHLYAVMTPKHGLRNPFLLDLSMHFTPAGHDTIAGVACQKWEIATAKGNATACVTEDGVILSEEGVDSDGVKGKLMAQSVSYGPIPETMFAPPAGFEKITGHMPHAAGMHSGAMSSH